MECQKLLYSTNLSSFDYVKNKIVISATIAENRYIFNTTNFMQFSHCFDNDLK
jgi:hypothetical protein